MSLLRKDLEYYLGLNYRVELERDDEGDYVASIPLLQGCLADGATPGEAVENLEVAKREWIGARLELGLEVPESQREFSGRWVVRTSRALHRKVSECAQREGVSINQFVNNVLAEAIGLRSAFYATQAVYATQTVNLRWHNVHALGFSFEPLESQGVYLPDLQTFARPVTRGIVTQLRGVPRLPGQPESEAEGKQPPPKA